jgi:hypothetical protein
MLPSPRPARRAIKGAIGTGVLAGAVLFGAAAIASGDPPPPVPPPCTAAELSRVMSGVSFTRRTTYPPTPTWTTISRASWANPRIRSGLRSRLI